MKLAEVRWTGESVNLYTKRIMWLTGLVVVVKRGLKYVIKMAFLNGFLIEISAILQHLPSIDMTVNELIMQARVLTISKSCELGIAAVGKDSTVAEDRSKGIGLTRKFKGQCLRCI